MVVCVFFPRNSPRESIRSTRLYPTRVHVCACVGVVMVVWRRIVFVFVVTSCPKYEAVPAYYTRRWPIYTPSPSLPMAAVTIYLLVRQPNASLHDRRRQGRRVFGHSQPHLRGPLNNFESFLDLRFP